MRGAGVAGSLLLVLLTAALVAGLGGGPAEGAQLRIKDQELTQTLKLKVGQSKVLRTPFAITRVSVADPEVADIILTSPREIYINGLSPGVTNLSLWGGSRFTSARVTVEADVSLLKEKLAQVLPKEKIAVQAADESIVLSGEVSGPLAQQTAVSLALPFVGNKKERVVNLLHVGGVQQVLVEVRVAEINRNIGRRLGINFNIIDRSGNAFGISTIGNLTTVTDLTRTFGGTNFTQTIGQTINAIAGWKTGSYLWTVFFDALKEQRLGRLLAEPNLVTTSGQEASFLAGGEFPVPVPQQFQTITIEWKKFGVGLVFTPTVLEENRIALKVAPEVSELDFSAGVALTAGGFAVPGIRVRRLSSHVEVQDGQTFAIAGLISDSHRTAASRFPVLGEIPILGLLFRSQEYQKNETELVFLVTPHLVKPITTQAKLPTEKFVEPSDLEFYLLGWQQGESKAKAPAAGGQTTPPGFGRQQVE
ncbi:MAG: type II and III secretion system protein family protein [Desulfobaccales bacterium]